MTLRKTIFWLHLATGLTVGLIVVIMSATGVAIAFEAEILRFLDREVRTVSTPENAMRLSLDQIDQKVNAQRPTGRVTSRIIPREANRAYEFRVGREGSFYVNPYTGEVREAKSKRAHDVIHTLEEWHRWLGREGDGRAIGKLITGIANLAFLFLCLTGVYMWWPRSWSPRAWRPAVWFVKRLQGRARNFNWHHVFGCWSAIVLIVIVTSGVVMSFNWAHRLVFTLAGEQPPQLRGSNVLNGPAVKVTEPSANQTRVSREAILQNVGSMFPEWKSVAFESGQPSKEAITIQPLNVIVINPAQFQTRGRIQLSVDPYRGDILQKIAFEDRSPGTRARTWLRFLHTGEAFGIAGKVIAVSAAIGSLFLVYTGFALSYRRFFPRKVNVVV